MDDPGFSLFPVIQTTRLLLRPIILEDAPVLFDLRSNELVMRFISREMMITVQEAEELINSITGMYEKNEALLWVICLPLEPEKLIGTIGFWHIQKEHQRAEIGYILDPTHWNKGIMKEALRTVCRYGFVSMQLHSIEARIDPYNIASAALLESTGFSREAYFKENYYFRGTYKDTAVYSLLTG